MLSEADLAALRTELAGTGELLAVEGPEAEEWAVHGVLPRLVCRPRSAEALAAALAGCDRAGAAVIPWGGGTQQRPGNRPARADVVLTTGQLDRVLEYEPADLTVTVESGLRFADLQSVLRERGQWLPVDPPVDKRATIGGILATNVTGPRRLKEGGLRDLVIGTRVANTSGALTRAGGRVVKNVTGYDLNKLHIGALGTLGVLVEASFKVAPLPESDGSWFSVFRSPEDAAAAAGGLSWLPALPSALELMNDRVARRLGLPASQGSWTLLGRATGFRQTVERQMVEFRSASESRGAMDVQPLDEERAAALWRGYAEMAAGLRWSGPALTCRFALPPGAVGRVCSRAGELGEEPLIWAHATGALFWSSPVPGAQQAAAVDRLRAVAGEAGGQLVVESWDSGEAGVDVWGPIGKALENMRAVKAQYDPRGTLNPGRFVGGV